jgi:hypothetical protein
MTTTAPSGGPGWAPAACTLPTAEQPLRLAEFDDPFARHVREVHRAQDGGVVLELASGPDAASTVAGLAARETGCCSFFAFDLHVADGTTTLTVAADGHADVLAALADRARARAGTAR